MGTDIYLKTRQVAQALGVSVSTVKRWVDSGCLDSSRTMGKHRLVSVASVEEFARRENYPITWPESPSEVQAGLALDDSTVELLAELLKSGQARQASTLMRAVAESGHGAVGLADHLIRPVMERVGHGWMVGTWNVYQEHQATQVVIATLMQMIRDWSEAQGPVARPLALGASSEGDPYLMPNLLGELVLRQVGWEVRNLGGGLPLKSLAAATLDYRPSMVFLAVGLLEDRDRFLQDYAYFYEAASKVGAAIIVGGRGLEPDLRARLVYASFGDRMSHLAEFARRMLPGAGTGKTETANPLIRTPLTT